MTKHRLNVELALLALLATGQLSAAEDPFAFDLTETTQKSYRWSGDLAHRAQYQKRASDWLSNRFSAQLAFKWEAEQAQVYASGWFENDSERRAYSGSFRGELRELYWFWDAPGFDLTVGKQRVAWGTADGASTIDLLNAVDLRDPIGNARTASRRPSWLVRLETPLSGGVFEVAVLPRGKDRKLPEFGSPWEPASLNALRRQSQMTGASLDIVDHEDVEGGIRYRRYGAGFDWSIAVYNGFPEAPGVIDFQPQSVRLFSERETTWNVSAAAGLQKSTLRAEIAYTDAVSSASPRKDRHRMIVGWDRTFFTNLYFNMQYFLTLVDEQRDVQGFTFALSNKYLDDAIETGIRGQIANDSQYAVESFFDWSITDGLKLGGKALVFGGDKGSSLGDFRDNDLIELTLSWSWSE